MRLSHTLMHKVAMSHTEKECGYFIAGCSTDLTHVPHCSEIQPKLSHLISIQTHIKKVQQINSKQ